MGIFRESLFLGRVDAGKKLAKKLKYLKGENPIVLGLPRGGIPVAFEVAKELAAPLEPFLVKKLGAPQNPELAMGAISEGGEVSLNDGIIKSLGISDDEVEQAVHSKREELRSLAKDLGRDQGPLALNGRVVIVVDDGLATGATMHAALMHLKHLGVKKIVVALPMAISQSTLKIKEVADEFIALKESDEFSSVGECYEDFSQVHTQQVISILKNYSQLDLEVEIDLGEVTLRGLVKHVDRSRGWVLFCHGSGSSRLSPRNQQVAKFLNQQGLSTLLFDLLTSEESEDRDNVFDIPLLGDRVWQVTQWLVKQQFYNDLPVGYFGASTGAAAAMLAASHDESSLVKTIVSRGGRVDLAKSVFQKLSLPILLIVGGRDEPVLTWNRQTCEELKEANVEVITGATHLFEESGALEEAQSKASQWFIEKFVAVSVSSQPQKSYSNERRSLLAEREEISRQGSNNT